MGRQQTCQNKADQKSYSLIGDIVHRTPKSTFYSFIL